GYCFLTRDKKKGFREETSPKGPLDNSPNQLKKENGPIEQPRPIQEVARGEAGCPVSSEASDRASLLLPPCSDRDPLEKIRLGLGFASLIVSWAATSTYLVSRIPVESTTRSIDTISPAGAASALSKMLGGLYGDLPPPTSAAGDEDKPTASVWSSATKMAPPTLRKPSATFAPPTSLLRNQ
uniref:Uncharacterized protein n=1 Tax=Aegilops tauschii subsp. strangulata TaxID=200361 RepID=A0A453E1P8_AEGTS